LLSPPTLFAPGPDMGAMRMAQTASYGVLPGPAKSGMENTFFAQAYDLDDEWGPAAGPCQSQSEWACCDYNWGKAGHCTCVVHSVWFGRACSVTDMVRSLAPRLMWFGRFLRSSCVVQSPVSPFTVKVRVGVVVECCLFFIYILGFRLWG
jgi:hypothetical protein